MTALCHYHALCLLAIWCMQAHIGLEGNEICFSWEPVLHCGEFYPPSREKARRSCSVEGEREMTCGGVIASVLLHHWHTYTAKSLSASVGCLCFATLVVPLVLTSADVSYIARSRPPPPTPWRCVWGGGGELGGEVCVGGGGVFGAPRPAMCVGRVGGAHTRRCIHKAVHTQGGL